MKRIVLIALAALAGFTGFAQGTKKVVADKIVAVVGDKIVMKSDIDNALLDMERQNIEVPANARCMTLEQAMGIKALVLQAEKDSIPITDEEIETDIDNRIRGFIQRYGTKEELERIAGKSVYQLKEDFREPIRDQMQARSMRNRIVENVRITPNEVRAFYEKIPKDSLFLYESEVEVSQVVVYPKASREAEEYVIERLKDYKQQIESGKRDFKTLAIMHTEDPGSKESGGLYDVNRNSRELDPIWLSKAFTLKEGQVSKPFKTRFGYHIIQLISRAGDDASVRHILLIPQVTSFEMKTGVEKLDSVRANLISGTMQFGEAVNKYSDDEATKFTAGAVLGQDGSTYVTIDQLDKDLVAMLKTLKVGQYSQPVEFTDERGRKGVRIVYLKTMTEPHRENLKDDYNRIASRALEEKKNQALEDWFAKKVNSYYIKIDDEFKGCPEMQKWVSASLATVGKL